MFELADAVVLSRSGLTRLVDRLERDWLVERERGEADPRQVKSSTSTVVSTFSWTPRRRTSPASRSARAPSEQQTKQQSRIWRAVLGPQAERQVLEAIRTDKGEGMTEQLAAQQNAKAVLVQEQR